MYALGMLMGGTTPAVAVAVTVTAAVAGTVHSDRRRRYSRIIHMQMSDILTGFSFDLFDKVYRRRQARLCNVMGNYTRVACTVDYRKLSIHRFTFYFSYHTNRTTRSACQKSRLIPEYHRCDSSSYPTLPSSPCRLLPLETEKQICNLQTAFD